VFPAHSQGAPLLRRSVLALRAQTVDPSRFEVVIAVDGDDPDDAIARAADPASHPFACRVVRSPRPRGDLPHRNHARNAGCRAARGELLWVLDCDFLLPPNAIEHALHEHDAALGAGAVAVFSPILGGVELSPNAWIERSEAWARTGDPAGYVDLMASIPLHQREYSGFADRYRPGTPASEPCPTLPEGFPTCPRDLWAAFGGYDESFVGWGGNKREFVDRLRSLAKGGTIEVRLLTSVRALHQPHPRDPTGNSHSTLRRANHALLEKRAKGMQRCAPWWVDQRARAEAALRARSQFSGTPEAPTDARAWTVVVMTCNRPALLADVSNEAPAREPVLASMATIPGREDTLARTVASLLPQVSRLRVYLNGHERLPPCLQDPRVDVVWSLDHGDHGDAGKFWWCEMGGGYLFTCDDDIVYPPDYVDRMVRAVERYKRSAVVGVHGVLIHDRVRSYYRDRKVLHTVSALPEDQPVHLVATSSAAWHASTLVVRHADFEAPNMADIWLGVVCQRQKVPSVAVSRRAGWLQVQAVPTSIYDSYRQRDELQSRVVAEHCPWKIFTPP